MDNFNLKKFLRDQYLAEAEAIDEKKGKKIKYDSVMAVANFIQDITLEMDTLDVLDTIKNMAANDEDFGYKSLKNVDGDTIVALSKSFLNYLNQKGAEAGRVGDNYVDEWLDIVTKGKNKITKGDIEENDDVQAKVNAASKVKSKGGAEKKQARKRYGDKPNKSGKGKEAKRSMNKRNRKDAKQALKDA